MKTLFTVNLEKQSTGFKLPFIHIEGTPALKYTKGACGLILGIDSGKIRETPDANIPLFLEEVLKDSVQFNPDVALLDIEQRISQILANSVAAV